MQFSEASMPNRNAPIPFRANWKGEGPLAKFCVPERKIDEAGRRITFIISTDAMDRDGDIIDQNGWELADYKRNPVVLWAHDGSQPPVARAASVAVENGKLVSVAEFPTREQYAFADTIFQLYKGGFLHATSVGFMPEELELMEGPDTGLIGFRFRRQKLLEYSAVPIPSNPEALVVARSHGIDVDPCKKWIERILDERGGGPMKGLLNRTYIALSGKLHWIAQDEIAQKNLAALRDRQQKEPDPEPETVEEAVEGNPTVATAPEGEPAHTHELTAGMPQTEPGGEDGHVHAVNYDEDGVAIVEGAEGHTHEAPPAANLPAEQTDEAAEEASEAEPEPVTVSFTDWPAKGLNFPVSLLTSEYRTFPLAEAKALKEDWPEIWALGEGRDNTIDPTNGKGLTETDIWAREEWAARHVDDYDLAGVVSQVRHLVRGSRGIEHMRLVLSHAKEQVRNQREKAKGLSAKEVDQVADLVIRRAIAPALEKAFRQASGRVS
jgi:hypothetical protein